MEDLAVDADSGRLLTTVLGIGAARLALPMPCARGDAGGTAETTGRGPSKAIG